MTVIFKLGGSLLNMPELADRLQAVLALRSGQRCLIVPGGGTAADAVREWSQVHFLDEESAHQLAVSSLELNRQFLQKLCRLNCTSSRVHADELWNRNLAPLFLRMTEFLQAEEAACGQILPHNWSVTSDSLAAWAALCWPAEELVLLKSVPVPHGMSADQAGLSGYVDSHFALIAAQCQYKVHWCNLRSTPIIIEPWLADSAEIDRTGSP